METKRIAGFVVVALLIAVSISACDTKKQPSSPQDAGKETEQVYEGEAEVLEGPYPEYKAGDIAEEKIAPVTGARVYEEMQKIGEGIQSRVIVEYKGKKTELQPRSALIDISPDGRYVLYIYRDPGYFAATLVYDVVTGKTQKLTPSDVRNPKQRLDYVPAPEGEIDWATNKIDYKLKWIDNKIIYEVAGKTWTLTFNKE